MMCCAECFGDRGLRKEIAFRSSVSGTCDYCESVNVDLINPVDLAVNFEALLDSYEFDKNGKSLVFWLKEDWFLFAHSKMDNAKVQVLLGDIFDDGELARTPVIPSKQHDPNRLGQWDDLREELMHENRYFPQKQINLTELELLLPRLAIASGEFSTIWFRARIQSGTSAFDASQMKAPPPNVASHGRANPAGIPYLYLGSKVVTSVSEIRPHTGEVACIARVSILENIDFIDLRHPRKTVSPVIVGGAEDMAQMRSDLEFLERLGEELTRPVRREAAAFDYTPSQYVCEFIKRCGYDGVIYRSSVSDGVNLALFDPEKASIERIDQYAVEKVSVDVSAAFE